MRFCGSGVERRRWYLRIRCKVTSRGGASGMNFRVAAESSGCRSGPVHGRSGDPGRGRCRHGLAWPAESVSTNHARQIKSRMGEVRCEYRRVRIAISKLQFLFPTIPQRFGAWTEARVPSYIQVHVPKMLDFGPSLSPAVKTACQISCVVNHTWERPESVARPRSFDLSSGHPHSTPLAQPRSRRLPLRQTDPADYPCQP